MWAARHAAKTEHLVVGIEHAPGLLEKDLSEIGGIAAIRCLIEQRASDDFLDAFDLGCDRGLADAELLRGLSQASGFCHCHDGANDLCRNILVRAGSVHLAPKLLMRICMSIIL